MRPSGGNPRMKSAAWDVALAASAMAALVPTASSALPTRCRLWQNTIKLGRWHFKLSDARNINDFKILY